MRNSLIAGLILAAGFALPAVAAGVPDAAGNWKDSENGAILAFYDCDGDLCGKIAKPSEPGKKDDKNTDESKRNTPLDGLVILDHAKKSDDTSWKGNLYNADDGKTYAGYVSVLGGDKLQLKGCALLVFCKTLVLTKAP